jgi:hypothetical protein
MQIEQELFEVTDSRIQVEAANDAILVVCDLLELA